jgi:hypothetical protein
MTKYVLAVDPGKASGIVFMSLSGPEETPIVIYAGESQPEEYGLVLNTFINGWKLNDDFTVVCERFTINAQTVRNSQAPYSLEQIGVLKHICREHAYDPEKIAMQSPADAKAMFPNEALRKVGTWHVGGEGHANDAMRHALLRLVKTGWKPRVLLD